MPDDAPPKKTTDDLIRDLGTSMVQGFQAIGKRFETIEERQDAFETWRKNNSERVKGIEATTSSADLAHDAALAKEITDRQSLAAEVAAIKGQNSAQLVILQRLDAIADKPVVKRLAWLAVAVATGWLTLHMVPPSQPLPTPAKVVAQ